ncbi:MAG TPA: PH domain-containing protein [Aequorivita sp.]|nr:PH domain-containing protein [Aequorivita sp.]
MKTFPCSSSTSVKIITIGVIIGLLLLVISIVFIRKDFGPLLGSILTIIIFGLVFYFYANSLKSIVLTDKNLILQKHLGKIEIEFSQIEWVKNMQYSALPMTVGSKGVFGFIGSTVDGATSFVKDQKNMVQIKTLHKKYLISCDSSTQLIDLLESKTHIGSQTS